MEDPLPWGSTLRLVAILANPGRSKSTNWSGVSVAAVGTVFQGLLTWPRTSSDPGVSPSRIHPRPTMSFSRNVPRAAPAVVALPGPFRTPARRCAQHRDQPAPPGRLDQHQAGHREDVPQPRPDPRPPRRLARSSRKEAITTPRL